MENKIESPDFEQEIIEKALYSAKMTTAQRNKKLLKWTIRQVLSIAFAYWFWEKTWMKYALWIWIPLAVLNLALILFFNKIMAWRLKKRFQKTE